MPDSVDKQGSFYGSKAQFLIPGDYTLLKTYNIIIHFCYLTLPPHNKKSHDILHAGPAAVCSYLKLKTPKPLVYHGL